MLKPEEQQEHSLSPMQRSLLVRVTVTLVAVAVLHMTVYGVRLSTLFGNMETVTQLAESERCVGMAAEIRTLSREVRIGDGWVGVPGASLPPRVTPPSDLMEGPQLARLQQLTQVCVCADAAA